MQKTSLTKRIMRHKATPLIIILVVFVIFTMFISSGVLEGGEFSRLFTKGFMAKGNLRSLFNSMVIQCFFICGVTLILISGNIDLSLAGQACFSSMLFAWLCANTALPWGFVLIIILIFAVLMGLVNTFLVNVLKFPSFIATIGMASVYAGLCNVITKGNNISIARQGFNEIGRTTFGFVPVMFVIGILLVIVYQFILSKTPFGRRTFMCGGNPAAARLAGLKPDKMRRNIFIHNSVLAVLGGLAWTSQVKLANPTGLINAGFDFRAISAAILGGVAFFGGAGSVGGAFAALLLLNVFDNMLTILKVQSYWSVFASGFVLLIALIVDYITEERRRRMLLAAAVTKD